MKDNFKVVDNFITEENVNSHFKYEFIPKKIEPHLTSFLYDLETHNADRARPYVYCFYGVGKLGGKYKKGKLTPYELDKCKKDTIAFDGDDCVTNA